MNRVADKWNAMAWRQRARPDFAATLVAAVAVAGTTCAAAASPAVPPCDEIPPQPAYGMVDEAPTVQVWTDGRLVIPPTEIPCLGWSAPSFRTLVAVAGSFRSSDDSAGLLARFGTISGLLTIRYWSVTDHAWLPLVTAATALTAQVSGQSRGDFTSVEVGSGRDLFLSQRDNRASTDVVYRMRVRESAGDRFIVETENLTPVRWWGLTLFSPAEIQAVYFLQERTAGVWSYYSLTKIGGGSWLTAGHEMSYVNRAVALYRHLAGIPTDLEPPAAR
jgi:hypothetical protein